MNTQQIKEALTITDENITELKEIYEERLADWGKIYDIILASFDNFDSTNEGDSIRNRPLYEKLVWLTRFALLNGYVAALRDVQEAQQHGLERE